MGLHKRHFVEQLVSSNSPRESCQLLLRSAASAVTPRPEPNKTSKRLGRIQPFARVKPHLSFTENQRGLAGRSLLFFPVVLLTRHLRMRRGWGGSLGFGGWRTGPP